MNLYSELDHDANFVANELACMTQLQLIEMRIERKPRTYIFIFGKAPDDPICGCQIEMVEMASRSLSSIIETYFDVLINMLDDFGGE